MSSQTALSLTPSQVAGGPSMSEKEGLQRHLHECERANGAWHSVRCTAETVDAFMSGRFVSTVVVVSGLLAVSAYW